MYPLMATIDPVMLQGIMHPVLDLDIEVDTDTVTDMDFGETILVVVILVGITTFIKVIILKLKSLARLRFFRVLRNILSIL